MRWKLVAILCAAACSSEPPVAPPAPPAQPRTTPEARADASARYLLRFAGEAVGLCELSLHHRAGGYRYRRRDSLSVLRDGERVDSTNTITIDADASFSARAVRVVSQIGSHSRVSHAHRDSGGWLVTGSGGLESRRPSLEVAELALFDLAGDGERGPMLLAGADFAAIDLDRDRDGGRVVIELAREALGATTIAFEPGADGLPARWSSDSGESATRILGLSPTVVPIELLDLAALPGAGRRSSTLWIRDVRRPAPPSLAGQRVEVHGTDWKVDFDPRVVAVPAELAALVVTVADMLEDDLTLPGLSATEALRMGRGDCSGHAAALAQLADGRGYTTRLATGYRRRGGQWLRHRWVIARVEGVWISLDPSFGEVPPPGRLLLLASHDAGSVALADLVSFAGMGSATAAFDP